MAKSNIKKISDRAGVPVKVNPKARPTKIQPIESRDVAHICVCCGKEFKKLNTNFPISKSPLYAGNGGYVPICRACMREYFKQVVEFFCGNEDRAMERICSLMDIYYSPEISATSHKDDSVDMDPMLYPGRLATSTKHKGKCYLDTMLESKDLVISTDKDFDKIEENHDIVVSQEARRRWGLHWNPEEYAILEDHYNILRSKSQNPDEQELQIHQLCEIYVLQYRARIKGDVGEYEKTTKLYNARYDAGEFKTGINKDDSFNQPLGVMNMIVNGICPSEYYKDKKMFDDHDKFKEYWQRMIIRPFKNLFFNSRDMDPEYSIKDGDEE